MGFSSDQSIRLVRFHGTRPFKTEHSKTPIVARVYLDHASEGVGFDSYYAHPTLTFGREYVIPATNARDWTELASVRFQRHRLDRRDPFGGTTYASQRPVVAGFMGVRGRWSHAYGPEFRVNAETPWLGACLLRLIERAKKAGQRHSPRKGFPCDLLAMIVGLRAVGVDVTVKNPYRSTVALARKVA